MNASPPSEPFSQLYLAAHELTSTTFPGPVFHYTDQAGFVGLLRDKAIWATDLRYLNDSREYLVGFERIVNELVACVRDDKPLETLLADVLKDITPVRALGVSVASFSLARDDLSQWRAYSGGSGGISVGFDPALLAQSIRLTGSQFGAVRYTEIEQIQIVKQLCSEIINEAKSVLEGTTPRQAFQTRCMLSIQLVCALLKHQAFEREQEWRMVVWSALTPYVHAAVRTGRSMLIPYFAVRLDIAFAPAGALLSEKLPLSEVWIGPTPHPDLALRGAWTALSVFGQSAALKMSEVPFRNW